MEKQTGTAQSNAAQSPADRALRVVILEDVPADAELMEVELREEQIAFTATRVATRDAFVRALEEPRPDVILADYSLPGFDGLEALTLARAACPNVPFIFVSGAIGEELAIETLKGGATDYVLKHRMSRLVPAVRRALNEAEERRERRRAVEALRTAHRELEARFRERTALLEVNNAIIDSLDRAALFDAAARALRNVVPFDRASLTLLVPGTECLRVAAVLGPSSGEGVLVAGAELPWKESHLATVIAGGQPHVRQDLQTEQRTSFEDELLRQGVRSYVALPLISKRGVVGTLNVGSRTPNTYAERDTAFLMAVAEQVALAIENMLAYEEIAALKARLERENIYLQEEIRVEYNVGAIVGQSLAIRKVLQAIETVAPTDATVLIVGETGTGKELVARAVHELSPQRSRPLVKVNCAALPAGLVESELFGHEKGAFTGAAARRIGRFELADRGTIFLDEIGDLPLDLQAKLLRVLEQGEFDRVGGSETLTVNVRVITATNRELQRAVDDGRFRGDLYYRLNVFPIRIPPLRERPDDIRLLVQHFVRKHAARLGKRIEKVPERAMDRLQTYQWPGNVRELEHVIERAVILSDRAVLDLRDWQPRAERVPSAGFAQLDEAQRAHILEALERTGWVVSGGRGAARLLGMKATTLEARMKKLGIRRPNTT